MDARMNVSRRNFVAGSLLAGGALAFAGLFGSSASMAEEAKGADVNAETGLGELDESIIETYEDGSRLMNDQLGEVVVPAEAFRIATTAPAHTTGILLLGGVDKLVALEENFGKNAWIKGKYPQLDELPVVFASNETNMEELLNQSPDLVCYATRYGEETLAQLKDLGIACVGGIKQAEGNDYDHIYRVRDNAVYWGYAIGGAQLEKAEQYRDEYTAIREEIEARTADIAEDARPTVVEISSAGDQLQVNNGTAIGQELIDMCGGINAAKDAAGESAGPSGQTIVDPEQLLQYNPDILLIDRPQYLQALLDDPILSELDALKSGRYYIVPTGAMSWSYNGAEEYVNMWFFAKAIQPELFADIDMEQVTRDFYANYFGFELTDEDIATLFNLAEGETVVDKFDLAVLGAVA